MTEKPKLYELYLSGRTHEVMLTVEQWFHIFIHGKFYDGAPVLWMQTIGKPETRVTFEENINGS